MGGHEYSLVVWVLDGVRCIWAMSDVCVCVCASCHSLGF